jgi:hypothetical protein
MEITYSDRDRFALLVEQFADRIELNELRVDEENCCSISIGEESQAAVITLELRSGGELLIFTTLDHYPGGVSSEVSARIEVINSAHPENRYYLTTSGQSVFLCASYSIADATVELMADWVLDFYKEALEWRERYRQGGTERTASDIRFSPSKGLKV